MYPPIVCTHVRVQSCPCRYVWPCTCMFESAHTHTTTDRQTDRQTHCHVCVHKCVSDRHTLPPISAQYMPPPHPAPSTVPGTRVCGFICQVAEEIILEHTVVAKSKHTRVGTCLRNRMRPCAGASVGKSSTEHDLYRYVAR